MTVKKLLKRVPLLLFVAGLIAALAYGFRPSPLPVDLAAVGRGPLRVTVDEDGRTRIKQRYVVSAPLEGRMQRVEFKPGDKVRSPLLVIEPPAAALLDPRARDEAAARERAAASRLDQAKANRSEAQASEGFAQAEYDRLRRLTAPAQEELERAQMKHRTAEERVQAAQFGVHVAKYELELARAALRFTEPALPGEASALGGLAGWLRWRSAPYTEPVSPGKASARRFEVPPPIPNGRVLRVMKESATVVQPGTEILEVGDPEILEAEIDLLTTDAVKVPPKAMALLEHWGGKGPLKGHVRLIEPSGFMKVSALGVEEQRVNVLIDFTVPPEYRGRIGDAYRVEARIIVWEGKDVLKVPSGALSRRGKSQAVFVLGEGKAELRPIKVGHNNGLEAEILDGLAEGEQVVLHPGDKIKDGVAIVPRAAP